MSKKTIEIPCDKRVEFQRNLKKIRELMGAHVIKYATHMGKFTDAKKHPDYNIQAKGVELHQKLLGLQAPTKYEHSGPDGGPIAHTIDPMNQRALKDAIESGPDDSSES